MKSRQQTPADRTHGLFQPEPEDIHRQAAAACLTYQLFHGHGVNKSNVQLFRLWARLFEALGGIPEASAEDPVHQIHHRSNRLYPCVALDNKLASEYGADKVGEWVATNNLSKSDSKAARLAKAATMDVKALGKARRQRTTRQVDGEVLLKQVEPINKREQDEDVFSQVTFCIDPDTKSRIGYC